MRVFIATSKRWGDSKEVQYSVRWWESPKKKDEHGDLNPDDCVEHQEDFKNVENAMRAAKIAANRPDNHWAAAQVDEWHLEELDGDVWDWELIKNVAEVTADD